MRITSLIFRVCAMVWLLCPAANASNIPLSGHVFDKSGRPVRNAKVVFWSFGATTGIQPVSQSDQDGVFSLSIPESSSGFVSASKVEAGYPDAALAFYGKTGYHSLQTIDTTARKVNYDLDLRFGDPQTTIALSVIDAVSGKEVKGAVAYLQAISNSEITGSATIENGRTILIVLPRSPMRLRIEAPGYIKQEFTDQDAGNASGEHRDFAIQSKVVKLKPAS